MWVSLLSVAVDVQHWDVVGVVLSCLVSSLQIKTPTHARSPEWLGTIVSLSPENGRSQLSVWLGLVERQSVELSDGGRLRSVDVVGHHG